LTRGVEIYYSFFAIRWLNQKLCCSKYSKEEQATLSSMSKTLHLILKFVTYETNMMLYVAIEFSTIRKISLQKKTKSIDYEFMTSKAIQTCILNPKTIIFNHNQYGQKFQIFFFHILIVDKIDTPSVLH